jgi:inorganic pyrophosphatase
MTRELQFVVKVSMDDGGELSDVRDVMKSSLERVYDEECVEKVVVIDKNSEFDESVTEVVEIIEDLESDEIQTAIELLRELENIDDG